MIDHAAIVSQIEGAVGSYGDLGARSTYNPKTKRYVGASDSYVPAPVIRRHDLWNSIGESPATWDHVRTAAPTLKSLGHPIGIGQANESDSNTALIAFMLCFGSFIQDESNHLTLDSKSTVEAVEFMADLYAGGEDSSIFGWNPASNNRFVLAGKGSMIQNAISAIRRAEDLGLPFAYEAGPRAGRADDWPSASTRASIRSGSSQRTSTRPRGSSQTSASTTSRRRSHRRCSTSRASPAPSR